MIIMATQTIWISAACAVLLLCGAAHGQSDCPTGWNVFNNRCFKLVTYHATFHKAQEACEFENSHLASVHSAAENNFIHGLVRATGFYAQGLWIGGSDDGSEGVWYWIDGSPFNFADWSPGQPNNFGDEDCLMMSPYDHLRWKDLRCDFAMPFVCSTRSHKPQMTDVISCKP
ncbi:hypothetical protein ACEWY4_017732 [Coilia grayii]|uniref:C-type lectin domain-containing protein n=1 Tax=Coilia grayii TaxID=363190 RepID=A0ABD1JL48_9TELE